MKQNTTYKQTELGLIPEDWEVKKLGEIGKIITGSTPPTANLEYYENGTFDFIGPADLNSNKYIDEAEKKVTINGLNAGRVLKKHSVLVTCIGSTIGKIGINKNICITNQQVNAIETDKNNSDFIYYSILERNGRLKLIAGEQAVPVLNKTEFSKFKIPLPPLPEQKKIADCLSTWDIAIEKQNALINALTDRKKALIQQLLTGKKRLPGFSGEWKLNSINDLFIFKNGKAHENDIDENGKYILINSKFISTDGEISKKTNSNLAPLEVNDLVFVMSDVPNGKALAKFFLIKEDNLYTLNQRIGLLKIKKGNPIFMYYLLNRNSYFLMFDNGVGQTNLRKDDILDCPLNIPSLEEQTAIAEILATADRELQLQKEKLAQLQTQKKGLMQVLLTGKKRLIN